MAITEDITSSRILVAGCGNLGGAIASSLVRDHTVFGLRRSPDKVPAGVHPVKANLLEPHTLACAIPQDLNLIIYCLTPTRYDEAGYRDAFVTGLKNLMSALGDQALRRLVFISSSSVYAQNDDSWVDETSPTEPARASGKQILAGEQLALNSGTPATIVRFSGIYGPSRRRFLQAVINGEMDPESPAPFSNRIHEADAAGAVCHLSTMALQGQPLDSHYLASDCEPVRLDDVVAWVQSQVACQQPGSDARKGGRAGSKRCSNQRLLDTGFQFKYPDFRVGYGEMIKEHNAQS